MKSARVTPWARSAKLRPHVVRYTLQKLIERQVIGRVPYINVYPYGLTQFGVFVSLTRPGEEHRRAILNYLIQLPDVTWLTELVGVYQIGFSLCARHPHEVHLHIQRLLSKFGNVFKERTLNARLLLRDYPMDYLEPRVKSLRSLSWGVTKESVALDQFDRAVIDNLGKGLSAEEIARLLGKHASTVRQRLQSLQTRGVLVGYQYLIDYELLNISVQIVLLSLSSVTIEVHSQIEDFCRKERNITYFLQCIGHWDYEIAIEYTSVNDFHETLRRLKYTFDDVLNDAENLLVVGMPTVRTERSSASST